MSRETFNFMLSKALSMGYDSPRAAINALGRAKFMRSREHDPVTDHNFPDEGFMLGMSRTDLTTIRNDPNNYFIDLDEIKNPPR